MSRDLRLMIPGPVGVDPLVLEELNRPVLPHFGEIWMPTFKRAVSLLRPLFGTAADIILMPGPGTGALDAALGSLISASESVCVAVNGFFGARLVQQAEAFGINVYQAGFPEGLSIDPEQVRANLARWIPAARSEGRPIRGLALVHHETSTGVLNPLKELAALAHDFDLPVIVDAVASLGGVELCVDDWGIDVCVGVPNKCLGAPAGLALVSVSNKAWKLAEKNVSRHGWYYDLRTWAWYKENWPDRPYPTTLPTNNIAALVKALEMIFACGFENHVKQFEGAARRVRSGMSSLGFDVFPDPACAAPMQSVFRKPQGFSVEMLLKFLLSSYGLLLADGLGGLKGKILRIGHMGEARHAWCIDRLLEGVQDFIEMGSRAGVKR